MEITKFEFYKELREYFQKDAQKDTESQKLRQLRYDVYVALHDLLNHVSIHGGITDERVNLKKVFSRLKIEDEKTRHQET